MTDHRRGAFTLIELLVVISIIILLIAILLPSLSKARTSGHMAQSMSNVRQLQIPLYAYAQDNKSDLPLLRWPTSVGNGGVYSGPWADGIWAGVFYHGGYVSDHKVYWSPLRDLTPTSALNIPSALTPTNAGTTAWYRVGYALIGHPGTSSQLAAGTAFRPAFENYDQSKPQPSRTISMIETWRSDAQGATEPKPGWYQMEPWHTATHVNRLYTYDGRVARAFHDGHAEGDDSRNVGWNPNHPDSTFTGNYGGGWTLSLDDWRYRIALVHAVEGQHVELSDEFVPSVATLPRGRHSLRIATEQASLRERRYARWRDIPR